RTVGEVSRSIVQSLPANTNDLAAMLNLAVGGTAALSATALGPAIAGVAAAAYAHHVLTAAMDRVEVRLDAIEDRLRNADRGVIEGARQLADEMTDWGPPHLWPQQLRFELAIRRAALDPVCYVQRKVVEQLIDTTVR